MTKEISLNIYGYGAVWFIMLSVMMKDVKLFEMTLASYTWSLFLTAALCGIFTYFISLIKIEVREKQ